MEQTDVDVTKLFNVDAIKLLHGYMTLVACLEGTTFISNSYKLDFSEEEWCILNMLDNQIRKELN